MTKRQWARMSQSNRQILTSIDNFWYNAYDYEVEQVNKR